MDYYVIAHAIKDKFPFVWKAIEKVNEWLFGMRYGRIMKKITISCIPDGYNLMNMREVPTVKIVEFFEHQPLEAFTFFKPHKFDFKSIKRLQKNKSYLAYLLLDKSNNEIAGYCFNRCFFQGKGFRGRMVDINYRGKGLGTAMNRILNEVGFGIGLRLFETVSKDNTASYKSALAASKVIILKKMPNNELYLEILPD